MELFRPFKNAFVGHNHVLLFAYETYIVALKLQQTDRAFPAVLEQRNMIKELNSYSRTPLTGENVFQPLITIICSMVKRTRNGISLVNGRNLTSGKTSFWPRHHHHQQAAAAAALLCTPHCSTQENYLLKMRHNIHEKRRKCAADLSLNL
jgi:hypothetical protein